MNGQPATEVIGTALDAGCGRRLKPPAARRRWLLAVVLALFTLPLADGGALAQCARCGQTNMGATIAAPAPVVAAPRRTVVAHLWSGSDTQTSHHGAARPASSGGGSAVAICVRTCDGSFFPASYASEASRAKSLADVCRSLCPNAEVAPYSFPFGGTIDQAVSTTGEPYNRLPNAHKFEQAFNSSCSCRAPGQSWAEALAAAEAKYRRPSRDTLVTAAEAERMSRPVEAAKPAPAIAAEPGPTAQVDPDLDVNGVDTVLTAAVKTISREASGVRDQDPERPMSFGLKQGHTIEETDSEGAVRKVRVLPTSF